MLTGGKVMKILRKAYVLMALMAFVSPAYAGAQQNTDMAPLGFTFGISDKDARNIIDTNGKRIIENNVDSKKIRFILMQGLIVALPLDLDGRDVSTGLEFYDKKLLSSSLILTVKDPVEESRLQNEIMKYLTGKYGEPASSDSMLYFKTWTWHMPDVKLVFHTNQKDNIVKVQYTYEPVNQAKIDDELDKARGVEESDPASRMFMEGNYSKPTGYDESHR